jgi:Uma2 family endonuclease
MAGHDQMKPPYPGVKLTYEDYVHFPEDGQRHELIDGEHFVTPTPVRKHQAIVTNLCGMMWSYLQVRPIGRIFVAPFDVIFSNFDVVQPDLLYLSRQRLTEVETSPWVKGAPNLVVEVGSSSTRKRDETIKRRLYERFGVEEYWVIDPELDAIHVYRRAAGQYQRVLELFLERGDVLTTPLLPELNLSLSKIFED